MQKIIIILFVFMGCIFLKTENQPVLKEFTKFEILTKGEISFIEIDSDNFLIKLLTDRLNLKEVYFSGIEKRKIDYYTKRINGHLRYDSYSNSIYVTEGIISRLSIDGDIISTYPCNVKDKSCRKEILSSNFYNLDVSEKYLAASDIDKIEIFNKDLKKLFSIKNIFDEYILLKIWNEKIFYCNCIITDNGYFKNQSRKTEFILINFNGNSKYYYTNQNISNLRIGKEYITLSIYDGSVLLLNDKLEVVNNFRIDSPVFDAYYNEINDVYYILIYKQNIMNLKIINSNMDVLQNISIDEGIDLEEKIKLYYFPKYIVIIYKKLLDSPEYSNIIKLYSVKN